MTETTTSTTRRRFTGALLCAFTTASAQTAATTPTPSLKPDSDAELIAGCDELRAQVAAYAQACENEDDLDEPALAALHRHLCRLSEARNALTARLAPMPATTAAGRQAKAAATLALTQERSPWMLTSDPELALAVSLARDLLREAV